MFKGLALHMEGRSSACARGGLCTGVCNGTAVHEQRAGFAHARAWWYVCKGLAFHVQGSSGACARGRLCMCKGVVVCVQGAGFACVCAREQWHMCACKGAAVHVCLKVKGPPSDVLCVHGGHVRQCQGERAREPPPPPVCVCPPMCVHTSMPAAAPAGPASYGHRVFIAGGVGGGVVAGPLCRPPLTCGSRAAPAVPPGHRRATGPSGTRYFGSMTPALRSFPGSFPEFPTPFPARPHLEAFPPPRPWILGHPGHPGEGVLLCPLSSPPQ